ncbi:MAG: hypothetical protein AB7O77_10800 [Phycisphaerales bacterium]
MYVDSGGYELAPIGDSAEPRPTGPGVKSFSKAMYLRVLNKLDADSTLAPLIITNSDYETRNFGLRRQAEEARRLFERFPRHAKSFLMKPKSRRDIDPTQLPQSHLQTLRGFDVVGVTADDLGRDLLVRLARLATLRRQLDEAGVNAPLHVWGGLDPLVTPLYFFAGADIFDGVSWLRYAFRDGCAISRAGYQVLSANVGVHTTHSLVRATMTLENRLSLDRMAITLQQWRDGGGKSFDMFAEPVRDALARTYAAMQTSIDELKERK